MGEIKAKSGVDRDRLLRAHTAVHVIQPRKHTYSKQADQFLKQGQNHIKVLYSVVQTNQEASPCIYWPKPKFGFYWEVLILKSPSLIFKSTPLF